MRPAIESWLTRRWYGDTAPGLGLRALAGVHRVLASLQKSTIAERSPVPVLVVGSDKSDGFETGQWQAMLDRAGYPKSAPPGRKPAPQTAATPAPAAP